MRKSETRDRAGPEPRETGPRAAAQAKDEPAAVYVAAPLSLRAKLDPRRLPSAPKRRRSA